MWRMMIWKVMREATRKPKLADALTPWCACRSRPNVTLLWPVLGQWKRPSAQHCLHCCKFCQRLSDCVALAALRRAQDPFIVWHVTAGQGSAQQG